MYAFYIVENVWTLLIRLTTFTEIFRILTKITFLVFGGFNNSRTGNNNVVLPLFLANTKNTKFAKVKINIDY